MLTLTLIQFLNLSPRVYDNILSREIWSLKDLFSATNSMALKVAFIF